MLAPSNKSAIICFKIVLKFKSLCFVEGLLFLIPLFCCTVSVDVRLGADGRVPCPAVTSVNQVIMLIGAGTTEDRQQIGLYSNNQNFSNDKYILAADFSAVIVKDVRISDQDNYQCRIRQAAGGLIDITTTLSVYGEQHQ